MNCQRLFSPKRLDMSNVTFGDNEMGRDCCRLSRVILLYAALRVIPCTRTDENDFQVLADGIGIVVQKSRNV